VRLYPSLPSDVFRDLRVLGNTEDAEDALQTGASAYRNLKRFEGRSQFQRG